MRHGKLARNHTIILEDHRTLHGTAADREAAQLTAWDAGYAVSAHCRWCIKSASQASTKWLLTQLLGWNWNTTKVGGRKKQVGRRGAVAPHNMLQDHSPSDFCTGTVEKKTPADNLSHIWEHTRNALSQGPIRDLCPRTLQGPCWGLASSHRGLQGCPCGPVMSLAYYDQKCIVGDGCSQLHAGTPVPVDRLVIGANPSNINTGSQKWPFLPPKLLSPGAAGNSVALLNLSWKCLI